MPIQLAKAAEKVILPTYLQHDESVPDNDIALTAGDDVNGHSYGNAWGRTIYRLREGIERFLVTDVNNPAATARAQSVIQIMIDMIGTGQGVAYFNHVPGGCNVLYLDGHVAFIRYPGLNAPGEGFVNEASANVVGLIASLPYLLP